MSSIGTEYLDPVELQSRPEEELERIRRLANPYIEQFDKAARNAGMLPEQQPQQPQDTDVEMSKADTLRRAQGAAPEAPSAPVAEASPQPAQKPHAPMPVAPAAVGADSLNALKAAQALAASRRAEKRGVGKKILDVLGSALMAGGGLGNQALAMDEARRRARDAYIQQPVKDAMAQSKAAQADRSAKTEALQYENLRAQADMIKARRDPNSPLNTSYDQMYRSAFGPTLERAGVPLPKHPITVDSPLAALGERLFGQQAAEMRAEAERRAKMEDFQAQETFKTDEQVRKLEAEFPWLAKLKSVHGRGLREGQRAAGEAAEPFNPEGPVTTTFNALQRSYIQRGKDAGLDQDPDPKVWSTFLEMVQQFTPERQKRGELGKRLESSLDKYLSQGEQNRDIEQQQQVPGWRRRPDAPQLTPTEAGQAREVARAIHTMRGLTAELIKARKNLTASEAFAGRFGFQSKEYGKIQGLRSMLTLSYRKLAELGVLNGPDLDLMLKDIPEFSSLEGFITGANTLAGISAAADKKARSDLGSWGYEPLEQGHGAARREAPPHTQGAAAPHSIEVDGQVHPLNSPPTPEQIEAIKAAGHRVGEVR